MQTPETPVTTEAPVAESPVPDFSDVALDADAATGVSADRWRAALKESTGRSQDDRSG